MEGHRGIQSAESSRINRSPGQSKLASDELADWLRLIYRTGLSPGQKHLLAVHFGGARPVLALSRSDAREILHDLGHCNAHRASPGSGSAAVELAVARDLSTLERYGAGYLPVTSAAFPELLKMIDEPPLGLFYLGDPSLLNRTQLAIVGSRHASRSAVITARDFATALAGGSLLITSGLAIGIDSAAHEGALDAEQPTVAVVATGIDRIYPYANRALHGRIVERGVVISEYPPGTKPRKPYFPQRNRIISGLSIATLVVEATLRSGSLITARLASEQGRDVLAVPGSIHAPGSRGCHALIKQGAALVESPEDILQELALADTVCHHSPATDRLTAVALEKHQHQVYNLLDHAPCPVDQIIATSGLTADQVSSILVRLELLGLVTESSGGYQRLPS